MSAPKDRFTITLPDGKVIIREHRAGLKWPTVRKWMLHYQREFPAGSTVEWRSHADIENHRH